MSGALSRCINSDEKLLAITPKQSLDRPPSPQTASLQPICLIQTWSCSLSLCQGPRMPPARSNGRMPQRHQRSKARSIQPPPLQSGRQLSWARRILTARSWCPSQRATQLTWSRSGRRLSYPVANDAYNYQVLFLCGLCSIEARCYGKVQPSQRSLCFK